MRTISIRLDDRECDELDIILKQMGQTKQTFYETYTKTVLRLRKIPFTIEAPLDPFYSEENMERLRRGAAQIKAGKGHEHDIVEDD